jgi:serine/threonine protein kinase
MMDRQPSDHDEPEDGPSEPPYCALLDEYWEDLQRQSEPDSPRWPIDPDALDPMLAQDLDVLNRLHRLRRSQQAGGEGSQDPTVWAMERFEPGPDPSAPGWFRRRSREREGDLLGGPVSGGVEARARGDSSGPTAPAPAEKGPDAGTEPPQRIGKYLVIEMLDEGGQARVFRVLHPELGKDFVLKLARRPAEVATESQADTPARDQMRREGRLLAQCDHPNLVRVVDLDVHEGRPFVVMEYVPGLTLEQFVAQDRPGPRQAARLVAELARAVAYLHARGIIHQDLKPRNVLIDAQGRPRLIDLGLVRLQHAWSEDSTRWTGGTAAYMSPEQAMSRADAIGPRTDVFGLGGLLYHMLTGRPLYQGASRLSVLRQALNAEYLPVRQMNPRVPRALERICHKALANDPERRYRKAVEIERALRWFLARRRFAAAGLIATVLLAVALIAPRATAPPAEPSANATPPAAIPRIVSFQVDQFRGDSALAIGTIGLSGRAIRVDDDVRVSVRLDTPAYCYLIALESDGNVQPCYPSAGSERPPRSAEILYPPGVSGFFGLTDGPGLHAFAAVASRRPLPPFDEWSGGDGLQRRWRRVAADGVWRYDDRGFALVSGVPRSEVRERPGSAPPAPFREVCEYLATLPEVQSIQVLGFPVRPKD